MSDLPRVLTGPPSLLPPCGAVNVETGAHCELANGHAQNHRGAFVDGIAQWPLAAPAPTGAPEYLPCQVCGGPHRYDTTVPSPLWNRVIRAHGLPEFLCLSCIVQAFAEAGENLTAELWGQTFNGTPLDIRLTAAPTGAPADLANMLYQEFVGLGPRDGTSYAQGFDNGALWLIDRVREHAWHPAAPALPPEDEHL